FFHCTGPHLYLHSFPYTTLFRSREIAAAPAGQGPLRRAGRRAARPEAEPRGQSRGVADPAAADVQPVGEEDVHLLTARVEGGHRSEEHTSELQSRGHLVCRLLLE